MVERLIKDLGVKRLRCLCKMMRLAKLLRVVLRAHF